MGIDDEMKDIVYSYMRDIYSDYCLPKNELANYKGKLWHYTTNVGMLGILGTNKLWATHFSYLNDHSEGKYGKALALNVLKDYIKENDEFKSLIDRSVEYLTITDYDVFVTSFCEKENLLSQWKGYAEHGSGYSLSFDIESLQNKSLKSIGCGVSFNKIIYEKDKQISIVKKTIDFAIKTYHDYKKKINNDSELQRFLYTIAEHLSGSLSRLVTIFKHPDFKEECEWRAVYFDRRGLLRNYDSLYFDMNFRAAGKNIVPYVELEFTERDKLEDQANKLLKPLVIDKIITGPKIDHKLAEKAISLFCENNNRPGITVVPSGTPLC